MGFLRHGERTVEMDDLLLAHVQVVLAARAHDGQDPVLVWHEATAAGSAPRSLLVERSTPTWFVFASEAPGALQEGWLRALDRFRTSIVLTGPDGALAVLPPPAAEDPEPGA